MPASPNGQPKASAITARGLSPHVSAHPSLIKAFLTGSRSLSLERRFTNHFSALLGWGSWGSWGSRNPEFSVDLHQG
ncbi:MAG: hypothetical protein V7L21_28150 [Nostoc sp.]|uniref:hypothetical protein n=1 Tax=Nostoc sp. TaxID=1180 RepID=UPI002FF8A7A0